MLPEAATRRAELAPLHVRGCQRTVPLSVSDSPLHASLCMPELGKQKHAAPRGCCLQCAVACGAVLCNALTHRQRMLCVLCSAAVGGYGHKVHVGPAQCLCIASMR